MRVRFTEMIDVKSDVTKDFGTSLRGWRNRLGLSQKELAVRTKLQRTYVSGVESGARNVSLENIVKLACALEISVATLFRPSARCGDSAFDRTSQTGSELVEILLVEDNTDDVELTLLAFNKARFANHVTVIPDGAEALDYLLCRGKHAGRALQPQIILLDLSLPKVDGLEVLSLLKADERTRPIPVVILTMSQDKFKIAQCLELGAAMYIAKPVDFTGLCQVTPHLNLEWALVKESAPGVSNKAISKALD